MQLKQAAANGCGVTALLLYKAFFYLPNINAIPHSHLTN